MTTPTRPTPTPAPAPAPAPDPLRHHRGHRDKGAFGEGFVPRMAEKVADAMGTVQFVLVSTMVIVAWLLVNHVTRFLSTSWHGLLHGQGFDPAPFILLNLVFSAVAYYSASMVMIAQKTQARRDQAREQADAEHREELATAQGELIQQNTALTADVHRLTLEVHALICGPQPGNPPTAVAPGNPQPRRFDGSQNHHDVVMGPYGQYWSERIFR